MRIPTSIFKPVDCMSKAGLASKALFIGLDSHLAKTVEDPVSTPAPKRPSEAKTIKDYAQVYQHLTHTQKAVVNAADVQKGRGAITWSRPDQDDVPAPLSIHAPRIHLGVNPPAKEAPSPSPAAAIKALPANGREEAERIAHRPRPQSASAAFRAVDRDRAQRTSIRTGTSGSGPDMAPGKYNPTLSCSTKHTPTPIIRAIPTPASATARLDSAVPAESSSADPEPPVAIRPLRPASALPSYYGLSSFRASKRRPMESNSAAAHLATAYYSEGYDSGLSSHKSIKLVTSFSTQVLHKPLMANSDSPAALGPGAYGTPLIRSEISAGHKQAKLRGTLSFSKQVTRPGSAPPASVEAHRNGKESAAGRRDARKSIEEEIYGSGLRGLREGGVMGDEIIYEDDEEGQEGEEEKWSSREKERSAPLGFDEIQKFTSYGFAKKVTGGGKFPKTSRAVETQGLRAMSRNGVIPPASGPLRLGAGADVFYDPRDEVQGHRKRAASARLPPNRHAGSSGWITSAALAYL